MIKTSILLPQRNTADQVAAKLPDLCDTMDRIRSSFEVIVIDDASNTDDVQKLNLLLTQMPALRVIQLDRPLGLSAAVSAGLLAARGQTIVTIEPGDRFPTCEIENLLDALRHLDVVFGRPRLSGPQKLWNRFTRIPRWFLLGLETRVLGSTFWAARSEALAGIELARGMTRYLGTFASMRGYRIGEIVVETTGQGKPLADSWPNPGDLLCAWWLKQRWRQFTATELGCEQAFTLAQATHDELRKSA